MPKKLYEGILKFKKIFEDKKALFAALSKGQFPDVLFITCSDSRVVPALFTHSDVGELFVIRNAGNIIAPYTPAIPSAEAATIEFALKHLTISDIIVCGHALCGAMKGLRTPGLEKELPNTAAWLRHAKPALEHVRSHHPELEKDPDQELIHLIQANVLQQMEHLKTHSSVAERLATGKVKLHGWYYDFVKGDIYTYNAAKKTFITIEEAIEELSLTLLNTIVHQTALAYLRGLVPFRTAHDYALVNHFTEDTAVTALWPLIIDSVRSELIKEVGNLYRAEDDSLKPTFEILLNKGALTQISITDDLRQTLKYAPFNRINKNRLFSCSNQHSVAPQEPSPLHHSLISAIILWLNDLIEKLKSLLCGNANTTSTFSVH